MLKIHLRWLVSNHQVQVILLGLLFVGCHTSYEEPIITLDNYHIESGFELSVVASEPLLKAPVAMDFDAQGRMWVVQMPGYMNDMQGSGENEPTGSIQILEDLDKDGVADHAKVFLDSLVMPRALAHVYDGLLYSEPPYLWFVEIENDKPINREIVDSIYAPVGNPEHQPNGLLMNMDNWIYNAKSNFRYQRKNGVWKKEPTTFRGQWGISRDNFGRLYYNDNSRQLLGDHVLPNRFIRNKYFTPKVGVNQLLTKDQRVYPLHATLVNRGYAKGILNKDSLLVDVTAACSPLVYRGGEFSKAYSENAFVCIPEANLIKRNLISFTGDSTAARQAWQGKEFLAATDEGFRPVNLYNGPDGSMYIVDMHRGMVGHHAYLSPYLKKKNEVSRLDTILDYGRILKVRKTIVRKDVVPIIHNSTASELVQLLGHKNGWIRDRAQHHLIFNTKKEVIPELIVLVKTSSNLLARMHALYTLEGLDALSFDLLKEVIGNSSSEVASHAIVLMEQFASEEYKEKAEALFAVLMERNDIATDLYLASTLGVWEKASPGTFLSEIVKLMKTHDDRPIFKEALISGLEGAEESFLKHLEDISSQDNDLITHLDKTLENQVNEVVNIIYKRTALAEDNRTAGAKMYFQICASCHGSNGEGIEGLAPPLQGSEHVADSERLGLIVLHGLQGPIHVKGKRYDINLAMPGLIRNETISDNDIAGIIAYVTNAFSDEPKKGLKAEEVKALRALKPKSGAEYTEEELLGYSKK